MLDLNDILNEHVDIPRNSSEPKRKQAVSPDLRPEAVEAMDPISKQQLLH